MVMVKVPQTDGILYRADSNTSCDVVDSPYLDWVEVTPEKHNLEWYDKEGTYQSRYRFAVPNEEGDDYTYTTLYSFESEMVRMLQRYTNVTDDKISY